MVVYYPVWRAHEEKAAAAKLQEVAQLRVFDVQMELAKLAENLKVGSAAPRSWGPRFFFRKSRPDRSGRYTCFGRDAPGLPIADGRIVNDPVEGAEPIHLLGHAASLGDAREITDDHGLRTRHGGERFLAPPLVASVCRTTLCPCSMRS
jgi:hypothetical protein